MLTMWMNYRWQVLNINQDSINGRDRIHRFEGRSFRVWRQMGRTLFLKFIYMFTRVQLEKRNCVDYMVEKFVPDNLQTVKEVIRRKVSNSGKMNNFLKLIPNLEESLKCFFLTHIEKGDDALHGVEYGIHEVNGVAKEAK